MNSNPSNNAVDTIADREEMKSAWRALLLTEPPRDEVWDRWYKSYRPYAPFMIREMLLRLSTKYKHEQGRMDALYLMRFANSILGRIDRDRAETLKKLRNEIDEMRRALPTAVVEACDQVNGNH